ncbi:dihydroxyacetone kinase subunit DhaK [Angustibacter aerolatus]|uniref:Dihydroxyacetone kinase subunit DhaK n=1 Tax=Angustibacter aerolatus TaxID=1162965 RepID=A0ABQ6JHS3_9ACTN|nr:dihydroxyacetone kinase subunit DhaK [Angustibacter aerolatus]GMA86780.1 dihydroxyacetone kinase subunit DhaK [Angustibacter aerolatus]
MSRPFLPADDAVAVSCRGFARAHADLVELVEEPLHLRARHRASGRRVGLVGGGGSGHEPLHAGFLGTGMLDAVAPGQVFASPHNRQVLEASRSAAGPAGVVHVVKNYTGDRINFGIAAERLRHDGIQVRRVLVDDDLATESDATATGRRGTAATVVVEKPARRGRRHRAGPRRAWPTSAPPSPGPRAAWRWPAGRRPPRARAGRRSTSPTTSLEFGVGIHGERAQQTVTRPEPARPARHPGAAAGRRAAGRGRRRAAAGERARLGDRARACTPSASLVEPLLAEHGLRVVDSLVGTFVAALDMHGFSLTLTRLAPGWLDLWRAPSVTPAFPGRTS